MWLLLAAACVLAGPRVDRRASHPSPSPPVGTALLLDLVGSVLESGSTVSGALCGVAECADLYVPAGEPSTEDSVPAKLMHVGRLLDLGADPQLAWAACARTPELRGAATAGVRCATSGARLADALRVAAAEVRASRHEAAMSSARRLGVWTLLPLGLCFLPAFVCLGIVPVVYGIASQALSR